MKKWCILVGTVLVAIWLAVDTVREFFANETIQYFSSEPQRLLYVAAIAIAGGFASLGFERLSSRAQRNVRILAWGALASTVTAGAGFFVFSLVSLSSFIIESIERTWVVVGFLAFAAIATWFWFEFYRALKRRGSL